jgi:beta-1,4-mannosyl-glycoprotein beta-1,4-N-acetylglucosaminyltransferase
VELGTAVKTMIYDCFTFYDELMLLEIRLKELYPVVDRFVLVESTHTHSGRPKRLYYNEAADSEVFAAFRDKIEHIVFEMKPDPDRWVNENAQRNAIVRGLKDAQPHDIIIVSDLDEIVDHRAIPIIKRSIHPTRLVMKFYYYSFNCRVNREGWFFAACCRFKDLITPQILRLGNGNGYHKNVITNAGWHYSYLVPPDKIPDKLRAFAHSEYDTEYYRDVDRLRKRINEGRDILERPDMTFHIEPLDAPKCVTENIEKYREFIK